MKNNKIPKTVGVLAPTKNRLFSINTTKSDVRIRIVTNAPQQQQEIRRVRAD